MAVLAAAGALWLVLRQHAVLPRGAAQATPEYKIVEQLRTEQQLRLSVEMPAGTLKSEIESVASRLLADAPIGAARNLDFYLGTKGPFNPAYASVVLQPGQPAEGFRVFLHRH
jgi:hypothetical protein